MLSVDKKRELMNLIEKYGSAKQTVGSYGVMNHQDYEKSLVDLQDCYNKILDFIYED